MNRLGDNATAVGGRSSCRFELDPSTPWGEFDFRAIDWTAYGIADFDMLDDDRKTLLYAKLFLPLTREKPDLVFWHKGFQRLYVPCLVEAAARRRDAQSQRVWFDAPFGVGFHFWTWVNREKRIQGLHGAQESPYRQEHRAQARCAFRASRKRASVRPRKGSREAQLDGACEARMTRPGAAGDLRRWSAAKGPFDRRMELRGFGLWH